MSEGGGEPTVPTPIPKDYTQRRGESTSNIIKTADKIIEKYRTMTPANTPDVDAAAEQARMAVRSNPANAAKAVEKFFSVASQYKPPQRLNDPEYTKMVGGNDLRRMPNLYDQDFSDLENHVRGFRSMERGPEGQALAGSLKATDAQKNLSELANLRGQRDALTKEVASAASTMPEAVSAYGEAQNQKSLADKNSRIKAMTEHITQLEKVTGNTPKPEIEHPEFGTPPPPPLRNAVEASGGTYEDFLKETMMMVDKTGQPNTRLAPGSFMYSLRSALSSMGRAGDAIMKGFIDAGKPQPGDNTQLSPDDLSKAKADNNQGTPVNGSKDSMDQRIESRQNEIMRAVNEIKNLKTFDSNWKVALFVMFSVILGPGPAALLFTNKAKRGELKFELDALERDLDNMIKMRHQNQQMQETARHHAISESLDERKFEHEQKKDLWYMQFRASTPHGKDKDIDDAMAGYRMWKDRLDEIQATMNGQFTYPQQSIEAAQKALPQVMRMVEQARRNVEKVRENKAAERNGTSVGGQ